MNIKDKMLSLYPEDMKVTRDTHRKANAFIDEMQLSIGFFLKVGNTKYELYWDIENEVMTSVDVIKCKRDNMFNTYPLDDLDDDSLSHDYMLSDEAVSELVDYLNKLMTKKLLLGK